MFRETSDGFKAIATKGGHAITSPLIASDDSIVNRVAERKQPVRLLDFNDVAARIAAFGSETHDLRLHKVMQEELLLDNVRSVLFDACSFSKTHISHNCVGQ